MKKRGYNPFPSNKILKNMGFFADQTGIMNRYINEKENWDEHLNKSKSFIIQCLEKRKPGQVVVLGSGWLLDVPMDFLLKNCENIYLIDIRHPEEVMLKYKYNQKIHFIHADITGGAIEKVYQILRKPKNIFEDLQKVNPPGLNLDLTVDYQISVNVMCQLDILILEYLRSFKYFNNLAFKTLRQNIQSAHIQLLQKTDSCLITDYEELVFNRTDEMVEKNLMVYSELPEGLLMKEWTWKFDTLMTYYPNRKTYFKVKAFNLKNKEEL